MTTSLQGPVDSAMYLNILDENLLPSANTEDNSIQFYLGSAESRQ